MFGSGVVEGVGLTLRSNLNESEYVQGHGGALPTVNKLTETHTRLKTLPFCNFVSLRKYNNKF